jgi:tetratricopeptide (TPR) repeat protein
MAYNYGANNQKAIIYLEKAVAVNPNRYDANFQLGLLYYSDPKKPKYKRAIKLFERAKKINPKNQDPYYYLGLTYYHQKQYYDALKETKKALDIKEDSYPRSLLGNIYFVINEYENALVAYKKSLAKDDFQWTCCNITKTLFVLEKYDEAIVFLRESLEKHRGDLELIRFLADAYKHKKDYETAIRKYKDCLESEPKDYLAHFGIASCYFNHKNWIEATNWWKKAAEINPKSSTSFYNIGITYFNMEQPTIAITHFKKALDIDPDDNKAKEWIKICQLEIDRNNFPEKLRNLSYRGGNVGILAKLLLCTFEYAEANNLFIQGERETEPEYSKYDKDKIVAYHVSPKIYESQGRFERIKATLYKISPKSERINQVLDSFQSAVNQRITGIEEYSKGYYVSKEDYRGEWERGRAKEKLADTYFTDGLKILLEEIVKYKSHFGNLSDQHLKSCIEYYEKKK